MLRIDFGVPVLVCLDKSPFPITFQRLMCVGEKITSNELRVVVRTYCRNGPRYMCVFVDRSPFPIRFSSLVRVCTKMTSNGLHVLGCVVGPTLRH